MSFHTVFVSAAVVASLAGCAGYSSGPSATAKLEPTRGNTAAGTVTFVQWGEVVKVSGSISGLKPGAEHGFHVHEKGDCSSGDGLSAGGHFNPGGKPHGHHGMGEHHTGDLPSVKATLNKPSKISAQTWMTQFFGLLCLSRGPFGQFAGR